MTKHLHLLAVLAVAALAFGYSGSAAAKTCKLSISGNDQMQYNKSKLVVGADCDKVKLTLKHSGQMAKKSMGHNWVLTKTGDYKDVAKKASEVGLNNGYIPDDDRIITHTDLIGGGEKTSVTFDVSALESGGDYTFFCSFPGHYSLMNGKLVVK